MAKAAFNKNTTHQQIAPEFTKASSEMLSLEHSFVWWWNGGTLENRNTRKFWNVVLEKDWSCKTRSITKSQGGKVKHPTYNKKKED